MSEEWELLRLGEVATIVGGGTPSTSDPTNFGGDIPWVTPKDLSTHTGRYVSGGKRSISKKGLTSSSAKVMPAGTVLVSSRAPIGLTAIAAVDLTTNQGCRSLTPDASKVDTEFLYYLMTASTEYLHQHANGTTFQELSGGVMKQLEFLFPPLDEQRRIAEVLAALDDHIAAAAALVQVIDEYFHCRWEALFGESQADATDQLRNYCDAQYGATASGTREPVGPRLLRVTDINKRNWVEWRDVPFCEVSANELAKYRLHHKDLVVARMADPGKSAIIDVPTEAVFASYLIRVKPREECRQYFTFGYLKSRYFTEYASGAASGSVQANMNAQTILDAPVNLPDPDELVSFETWAEEFRSVLAQSLVEQDAAASLRDFMLPRLISGELRVSEAEAMVEAVS